MRKKEEEQEEEEKQGNEKGRGGKGGGGGRGEGDIIITLIPDRLSFVFNSRCAHVGRGRDGLHRGPVLGPRAAVRARVQR